MVEVKRIELLRRPCKGPRLPLHQTPNTLLTFTIYVTMVPRARLELAAYGF